MTNIPPTPANDLYERIREILESTRKFLDVAEIGHAVRDRSLSAAQLAELSISAPNWKPGVSTQPILDALSNAGAS